MLQLLGFPLVGSDAVPFITHQESLWFRGTFRRGTKWAILLNLSTMVSMMVFPLEQGKPVTKCTETTQALM